MLVFLNAHAPTEDKSDDTKVRFQEALESVFDQFPSHVFHFVWTAGVISIFRIEVSAAYIIAFFGQDSSVI
jgi:hypothetical protein